MSKEFCQASREDQFQNFVREDPSSEPAQAPSGNYASKQQQQQHTRLIRENNELRALVDSLEKKLAAQKKKVPKRKYEGLLSDVGTGVGSIFGKKGSLAGKAVGGILGNMFGWGDYSSTPSVNYPVHTNTLFGRQLAQQMPLMHNGDGSIRCAHREYCFDIKAQKAPFTVTKYHELITPTNSNLFPWLSKFAGSFEQYKIHGMSFGFRGLASNTTEVGSLGSVSLMTQYDVRDHYVSSKQQMLGSVFATSCKPTDTMLHPIECDPERTPSQPRYTRSDVYAPEIELFNPDGTTTMVTIGETHGFQFPSDFFGMLNIWVEKSNTSETPIVLGELWVTYDISFYKPVITADVTPESKQALHSTSEESEELVAHPPSGQPSPATRVPGDTVVVKPSMYRR